MNEYTRREEVRWILVSAVVLVGCVAGALGLILSAQPARVPDTEAAATAARLRARSDEIARCPDKVQSLRKEARLLRELGSSSGITEEPEPSPSASAPRRGAPVKPPPKPKPELAAPAWPAAKPTHERARAVQPCMSLAQEITAAPPAQAGWAAVEKAGAVKPPSDGADLDAQRASAREVFLALEQVDLGPVEAHVTAAAAEAAAAAQTAEESARGATVRKPLPSGLMGREVAVAAGVMLSLIALLVSFFSLRATSSRRARSLATYRKATRPPERGLHAATILRLAAEPNGAEPGLVIGAGVGGLVAGLVGRVDADWYVAGVTAGLVVGVLVQLIVRNTAGSRRFRERALALADIEKPAVPIVLVLSTVQPGLEDEFLSFFVKLSPTEAANAVEKLANQAEEQILIAADAQAMR